jgi:hypothetical protein
MQRGLRHSGIGFPLAIKSETIDEPVYRIFESETGVLWRQGIRDGYIVLDVALTATGFEGAENTDWKCEEKESLYPEIPLNLSIVVISNVEISLDWESTGKISIERTDVVGGGSGWTEITETLADIIHYHDTGLTEGVIYYYRVKGVDGDKHSSASNVVSGLTQLPQPDGVPSALLETIISNSSVKLDWTINSTNHTGHAIWQSTNGTDYTNVAQVTGATATKTITGLTKNLYYFKITSYLDTQHSIFSNIVFNVAPLIMYDGNTKSWFISSDLTTITKDGNNYVSRWNDKLGSGRDLINAAATTYQPIWSSNGIQFDGSNDYMQTADFGYTQPEQIYIVMKAGRWRLNDTIIDGLGVSNRMVLSCVASTPYTSMYAGGHVINNLTIGSFYILTLLYNGASSSYRVNAEAAVEGNAALQNGKGLSLGTYYATGNYYGQIQFKEIILRSIADTTDNKTAIYNYLKTLYSL